MSGGELLRVDVSADYPNRPGVLRDVRFSVRAGEIRGIIGQSGSGKSTIALAILRLIEWRGGSARGSVWFDGRDLMASSERELRAVRGREIALVLQSPLTALNPALRIDTQLREVWRAHRRETWRDAREGVRALLEHMDLPASEDFLRRYPRQLSVGQAQRVVTAMAVMHRPKLLIADEPTSALDPVSQGEILDLFLRLNQELGMAILYISHDLRSVARFCQSVTVVRRGQVVETGPTDAILAQPEEEYTRQLVQHV